MISCSPFLSVVVVLVKFSNLFYCSSPYYTSNTIFCRTIFLKSESSSVLPNDLLITEATTDDQYHLTKVYATFNSTSSFFVLPIQGSGIICLSQSCIDGINPKSSATCCSPIQRVGIFLPLDNVIV